MNRCRFIRAIAGTLAVAALPAKWLWAKARPETGEVYFVHHDHNWDIVHPDSYKYACRTLDEAVGRCTSSEDTIFVLPGHQEPLNHERREREVAAVGY